MIDSSIKAHDALFNKVMAKCGVDSCECNNEAVEQPKKRVNLLLIFAALVALLISCSATY